MRKKGYLYQEMDFETEQEAREDLRQLANEVWGPFDNDDDET